MKKNSASLARLAVSLVLVAGLVSPLVAGAAPVVIDFNAATPGGRLSAPYTEDGYTMTLTSGHYDIFGAGTLGNSTAYLGLDVLSGEISSGVDLTGPAFNLTSVTALHANDFDTLSVSSSAGGYLLITSPGIYSFSGQEWSGLSWIGLGSSAAIAGPGFDDITLMAAVPVPAAGWLLGSWLALLAVFRRKVGNDRPEICA